MLCRSITHKKFRALGPIMIGERAAFVDNAVKVSKMDVQGGLLWAAMQFNSFCAKRHLYASMP
jgi:hypothetical protein